MAPENAEGLTTAQTVGKPLEQSEHLGRQLTFLNTADAEWLQAYHLRRRFGISPAHAAVIAELAFQPVRT